MALIPDLDNKEEVEVPKEAWPYVQEAVESVTIALESGASPTASCLFPTDNRVAAAAAIDHPVLLHSNRVVALGGLGPRLRFYDDLR
jgi:hypothetical protein